MGISRALDKTERSAASAVTRLLFYKIIERLEVMQRISRGPRYTYRITI
jgi:predicted transcriptional regulator